MCYSVVEWTTGETTVHVYIEFPLEWWGGIPVTVAPAQYEDIVKWKSLSQLTRLHACAALSLKCDSLSQTFGFYHLFIGQSWSNQSWCRPSGLDTLVFEEVIIHRAVNYFHNHHKRNPRSGKLWLVQSVIYACPCRVISMACCRTAVTPLLKHCSHCSLALSHQYFSTRPQRTVKSKLNFAWCDVFVMCVVFCTNSILPCQLLKDIIFWIPIFPI